MKFHDVRRILSLKCEEASHLASDSLDRDLSRGERWALRLHNLFCGSCRRLTKQLETVRAVLSNASDVQRRIMIEQLPRLSASRKQQIKRLLNDASRGEPG